jgi:hypothetical protein
VSLKCITYNAASASEAAEGAPPSVAEAIFPRSSVHPVVRSEDMQLVMVGRDCLTLLHARSISILSSLHNATYGRHLAERRLPIPLHGRPTLLYAVADAIRLDVTLRTDGHATCSDRLHRF